MERSDAERREAEYRRRIFRRRVENAVDEIIDRANLEAARRAARRGTATLRPAVPDRRPVARVGDGGASVGGESVVDRGIRIVPGTGGEETR